MVSITIRNLDDDVNTRLRVNAAENHRSMEEEARWILAEALERQAVPSKGLGTAIHELFKPFGGVDLELPPSESRREPPTFY
ncbi:MAG: plasmid stabilization protein [Gammaproteobacteria bacterium]|nr:plasmid stabilization protein [Gammaproteobacteria bacterium]